MRKAQVWTDWAAWRWSRSVLLTLAAVLTTASLRVFSLHDELLPGEVFWVGAMVVLVLGLAWLPRPVWWTSAFAATFVAFEVATPADHYGPAWLVAYAVCVDLNSRRPVWLGVAFVGLLAAPELIVGSVRDATYNVVYLALAAGLGQFIRTVFESSRSQARAHDLERRLELAGIAQDVHDTGTSRLVQVGLLADSIQARGGLPPESSEELDQLITSASSALTDLRRTAGASIGDEPSSPASFADEWERSLVVLRAAGLEVEADTAPRVASETMNLELARIVTEATANVCKHAAKGRPVAVRAAVESGLIVLEWRNESSTERKPASGGIGIANMWARAERLGGRLSVGRSGETFVLRVEVPVEVEDE